MFHCQWWRHKNKELHGHDLDSFQKCRTLEVDGKNGPFSTNSYVQLKRYLSLTHFNLKIREKKLNEILFELPVVVERRRYISPLSV